MRHEVLRVWHGWTRLEIPEGALALLSDLRIVELAAFVAAPLCGLTLARMGAEVIRIDPIGGGPDARRWPLAPDGTSLYWQGLNKAKKSVAINLSAAEGRELALAIAASGEGGGSLITNYPPQSFVSHTALKRLRADMITVRITGWGDGSSATDATVSATLGVSMMMGPAEMGDSPINPVIPAWDIAAANHAAFTFLAAERRRSKSGEGAEIRIALGDIAMATLADLGIVAETCIGGIDRPRLGNQIFGTFGRDFITADDKRVLIMALTRRHWTDLVQALNIDGQVTDLQKRLNVDFATDQSARYNHRNVLNALVGTAVAGMTGAGLADVFAGTGVCWAPYNRLKDAFDPERLISTDNPLFFSVEHLEGLSYPTAGAPAHLVGDQRKAPPRAPRLGEHTDEILSGVLGLSDGAIARLHDAGVAAGTNEAAGSG